MGWNQSKKIPTIPYNTIHQGAPGNNPTLTEIVHDAGLSISYGAHFSPFGKYLLAITKENLICTLQFFEDEYLVMKDLKQHWKASNLAHDPDRTNVIASNLFKPNSLETLSLLVKGTNFQLKVWEALLKIPFGEVVS